MKSRQHRIPEFISYNRICFYLRISVFLTLQSMEIDKRSNLEHHATEAVTLAITTV